MPMNGMHFRWDSLAPCALLITQYIWVYMSLLHIFLLTKLVNSFFDEKIPKHKKMSLLHLFLYGLTALDILTEILNRFKSHGTYDEQQK